MIKKPRQHFLTVLSARRSIDPSTRRIVEKFPANPGQGARRMQILPNLLPFHARFPLPHLAAGAEANAGALDVSSLYYAWPVN